MKTLKQQVQIEIKRLRQEAKQLKQGDQVQTQVQDQEDDIQYMYEPVIISNTSNKHKRGNK